MNNTSIEKAFEAFRSYAGNGRPYIMAVGISADESMTGPWSIHYLKPASGISSEILNHTHYFGYPLERRVSKLILGINDPEISSLEIADFLQNLKMMADRFNDCIEINCIILKKTGYEVINN